MMNDPLLILFNHPMKTFSSLGIKLVTSSRKRWKNISNGPHTRDPIKTDGAYLRLENSKFSKKEGKIYFYGEWEAEADIDSSGWLMPLQQIYPAKSSLSGDVHDTDPYVYNGNFYYCDCLQGKINLLKSIPEGSVIIFGQGSSEEFVFDTVIVVEKKIDYNILEINNLIGILDGLFYQVTLCALFHYFSKIINNKNINFNTDRSLYFGRKYHDGNDFFSFFPCKTIEHTSNKFPHIRFDGNFNKNMNVEYRALRLSSQNNDWDIIVKSVVRDGFDFGIFANV